MCAGAERGSAASTALHSRIVCSVFPLLQVFRGDAQLRALLDRHRESAPKPWPKRGGQRQSRAAARSDYTRGSQRFASASSSSKIWPARTLSIACFFPLGHSISMRAAVASAQPEIQTRVAGAEVASVGIDFPQLGPAAAGDPHLRADPETIALAAAGAERDPMIAIAPVIAQQQRAARRNRSPRCPGRRRYRNPPPPDRGPHAGCETPDRFPPRRRENGRRPRFR